MKDTFLTTRYRGGYIHTCWNRETEQAEFKVQFADHSTRPAKSFRSAQIILARAEKKGVAK